jgi:hypothetical protein
LAKRLINTVAVWFVSRTESDIEIPQFLDKYYLTEANFIQQAETRVFLDWNNYERFIKSAATKLNHIQTTIFITQQQQSEPILFLASGGGGPVDPQLWIVQNVVDSDLKRCLLVAARWRQNKVNTGYQTDEYKYAMPEFCVYAVNSNGKIELRQGDAGASLAILQYETGICAALLPLWK